MGPLHNQLDIHDTHLRIRHCIVPVGAMFLLALFRRRPLHVIILLLVFVRTRIVRHLGAVTCTTSDLARQRNVALLARLMVSESCREALGTFKNAKFTLHRS